MAYDNTAARKGQAFNLAVHTAIANGQERNGKYIYGRYVYFLGLAEVVQGSDVALIQKVIDNKKFEDLMAQLEKVLEEMK